MLTNLFVVSNLGLYFVIFIKKKCPSASVKPANQLFNNILGLSNKLFGIVKLYFLFKKSINWFEDSFLDVLSLPWTVLINNTIPFISPMIYLIVLLLTNWKRSISPNTD